MDAPSVSQCSCTPIATNTMFPDTVVLDFEDTGLRGVTLLLIKCLVREGISLKGWKFSQICESFVLSSTRN